MRALSVRQAWAELIILGQKTSRSDLRNLVSSLIEDLGEMKVDCEHPDGRTIHKVAPYLTGLVSSRA